ncbi:helix-turn-helix domain-containing protein [Flavobacterium branchiophilum]|uniref:HTH cro/C1-type domain-containing protein n=1 Tax=Flavobacterium branchiophilum TaxID=55197 RepID=A0A2H3KF37_9FLAO|nr:helix-turn-helix transcriptional regulator [Flavobacterium branchiophilum]PDS27071.1 hypothetical protein B0A77_00640 [Flavobacterium branchiophilum]
MTTISKNLKKIREKKSNYSQREVAEILGVKQNTYSTWESGECDVKSEFLPKLAQLFDVDIQDFFDSNANNIHITQNSRNNKDSAINGLVFVLSDKNAVEKLIEVLKNNVG